MPPYLALEDGLVLTSLEAFFFWEGLGEFRWILFNRNFSLNALIATFSLPYGVVSNRCHKNGQTVVDTVSLDSIIIMVYGVGSERV